MDATEQVCSAWSQRRIAAVRSAINNIGKIILEDHISHCIVDAVEHGDQQALEDLKAAIEKFIK